MKIAHVIQSLAVRVGGPPVFVAHLASTMNACESTAEVFTTRNASSINGRFVRFDATKDDFPAAAESVSVRVFEVEWPHRIARSPRLFDALTVSASEFDVIHVHGLFLYPHYAAWKVAKKHNIPVVVSPHGALDPYLRSRGRARKWFVDQLWQRQMLDNAGAIHVTSETERDWMFELGYLAPIRVVPIIVGFVDQLAFDPILPKDNSSDRSRIVIGCHGRISAKKGLDILIRGFCELSQRFPNTELRIVGPDDEGLASTLATLATSLGVGQRVVFPGFKSGSELADELRSMDVWVLPSHGENFGLAVVEAMAAGIPVVTTSAVNIAPEAAKVGAVVLSEPSAGCLAETVGKLLESPSRRLLIGQRGREYAEQFSGSHLAVRYCNLYQEVIDGSRTKRSSLAHHTQEIEEYHG